MTPLNPPPFSLPPLPLLLLLFFMPEFSGCDNQDYNDTSLNCQTEELIKLHLTLECGIVLIQMKCYEEGEGSYGAADRNVTWGPLGGAVV